MEAKSPRENLLRRLDELDSHYYQRIGEARKAGDLKAAAKRNIHRIFEKVKSIQNAPVEAGYSKGQLERVESYFSLPTEGQKLIGYNLQMPADDLYTVNTPICDRIKRTTTGAGEKARWKIFDKLNTNRVEAVVQEKHRGGVMLPRMRDYEAAYKTIGLENEVTDEFNWAAMSYQDARATATIQTLRLVRDQEEDFVLGGNNSLALGKTNKPVVIESSIPGSLTSIQYQVACVALTYSGYKYADLNVGIRQLVSRPDAGPYAGQKTEYNGGSAQPSDATDFIPGATSTSIAASVTPTAGAAGYAWYFGVTAPRLIAITSTNSILIKSEPTTGQLFSDLDKTKDFSKNDLIFDGFFTNIAKNSKVFYMPTGVPGVGSKLTSDGANGILEIEEVLLYMYTYDNMQLSPNIMYMSPATHDAFSRVIMAQGSAMTMYLDGDRANTNVVGGARVSYYVSKITGQVIEVIVHPKMIPGQILFYSDVINRPISTLSSVAEIEMLMPFMQKVWPETQRAYEVGVYAMEVLKVKYPPAFSLLTNIAV